MISITIKGSDELGRKVGRLASALDTEFRNAALRVALIAAKEAKTVGFTKGGYATGPRGGRRVPTPPPRWPITYRRTGRTSRTIRHSVIKNPKGGWFGVVGSASQVMLWLEEGTRRMRPRKLLARSVLRVQRKIKREFAEAPDIARRKVFGV